MKINVSAFQSSARAHAKGLALLLSLALGAAALSLGGCSCVNGQGDSISCPEYN
jgi:hypothetical protein